MNEVMTEVMDLFRDILIGAIKVNTVEFKAEVLSIYLGLLEQERKATEVKNPDILKLGIPNSTNILWINRDMLNTVKTIFFMDNMKITAIKALREHSCINGISTERPGIREAKEFVESMTPNM